MKQGKPIDERPLVGDVRPSTGMAESTTVAGALVALSLAIGFAVGLLVFLVMNLSGWLTDLLWGSYLDEGGFALFPLVLCTLGGAVIGVWAKASGCRIASLHEVMATFKQTGSYHVGPLRGAITFLLPLVFGGSVGFEAGLTGIITSACCWIRDKLKAAGLRAAAVADVTISASLAAVFGTPFAGIVAGAESSHDVDAYTMRRSAKLVLYTAAAFGAFGGVHVLSGAIGARAGFPHFDPVSAQGADYLWALAAMALAYAMTLVYHGSSAFWSRVAARFEGEALGCVAMPIAAGVIMGGMACLFPYVLFPGEEQAHLLMEQWTNWTAFALLATGVLKAFVTPMCMNMGWMGGNFCPSIFAGAACGYGIALLTGADPMLMVTVVTTGFLAGVVRKPLLTIAILLLCFPLQSVLWCGLAALASAALPIPRVLAQAGALHHARSDRARSSRSA